jgi:hypothetical protein
MEKLRTIADYERFIDGHAGSTGGA